jgi:hypothetical protein
VAPAGRHASRIMHYYTTNSSAKKSGDDNVDPLKYFNALHASYIFLIFSVSVMSLV